MKLNLTPKVFTYDLSFPAIPFAIASIPSFLILLWPRSIHSITLLKLRAVPKALAPSTSIVLANKFKYFSV